MFVRNDSPDTKENLRYRKIEKYVLIAIAIYAFGGIVRDTILKSQEIKHEINGLRRSPYFDGWLIDQEDGQLRHFREGLPLLLLFFGVFLLGSHSIRKYMQDPFNARLIYYTIIGIGFSIYLHGFGVIFLFLMVAINWVIGYFFAGKRGYPLFAWFSNLGFLLLAEYYNGFSFYMISRSLSRLDHFRGEMKWNHVSNLRMLNVVSFLVDWHWARQGKIQPNREKGEIMTLRVRQETHSTDYSFLSFIAYFFYPPLYLAGPTTTYNAWISQVRLPQQTYDTKRMLIYIVRFLICFVTLEAAIHLSYFPALGANSRNRRIWKKMSAYELYGGSYCILKWIWLKFCVIWRFFRLIALLDGIEPPENMARCMSNNWCFDGFWRMWHRGFNQWLIRYIYVPLGGSKTKMFNIWIVFGFVAIWHDLSLNLLAWGWGMCFAIVPETLAKQILAHKRFEEFRKSCQYNWLCACGGGVYIVLMMMANLVGFSFGVEGLEIMLGELQTLAGITFIVKAWVILTLCTHLMFIIRREEEAEGSEMKGY